MFLENIFKIWSTLQHQYMHIALGRVVNLNPKGKIEGDLFQIAIVENVRDTNVM